MNQSRTIFFLTRRYVRIYTNEYGVLYTSCELRDTNEIRSGTYIAPIFSVVEMFPVFKEFSEGKL